MRDYYVEYISKQRKSREGANTKGAKGTEGSFAPYAPRVDWEFSKTAPAADLGFVSEAQDEQSIIVEERIAIMMFDGGLSEDDAIDYVTNRQ